MSTCHADICAGILVGGRGRRLGGVDKARLAVGHGTILQQTVALLRRRVSKVLLVGRSDQAYPEVACDFVVDATPDAGPLGGLVALLRASTTPWCWLLACDLPRLDAEILEELAAARRPDTMAVVFANEGGALEPTAALYHRDVLPDAERALARSAFALQDLLRSVDHVRVPLAATTHVALTNINHLHDLRELVS